MFKPKIGNVSLVEINNDNGIRVVKFATSKYLNARSTMFPDDNIPKYTFTYPDGKTHNQIKYVLTDKRRHSTQLMPDRYEKPTVILIII